MNTQSFTSAVTGNAVYCTLPSASLNLNSKSHVESAPPIEVLSSTAEKSNVISSSLSDCFHHGRLSTTGRKSGMGNLIMKNV